MMAPVLQTRLVAPPAPPPPHLPQPSLLSPPFFTQYASWDDSSNRNQGQLVIYPTQDGTSFELYEETSLGAPIQIGTLVMSGTGNRGQPRVFGPLASDNHFFKVVSDKPVNVELVTMDYEGSNEANRFVISEDGNYRGTGFYFYADSGSSEKMWVINPSTAAGSGAISLDRYDPATMNYSVPVASVPSPGIPAQGVYSATPGLTVPSGGFFRFTSENPVLVWEGRNFNQNMAIGAAEDGSTIGSEVYAAVPYDEFVSSGFSTTLRVIGITSTDYDIFANTGAGFFPVGVGYFVGAEAVTTHAGLPDDRVYKIVATSPNGLVQVQYATVWSSATSHGGAEMIPGRDDDMSTNPGTSFLLFSEDGYQNAIDVIMAEAGTVVNITGPTAASFTSTVPDEVFHFTMPGNVTTAQGLFTITATNPVWVIVVSELGDQQGYFVWRGRAAPPPPSLCHGQTPTIVGTPGSDVILGTNGPDVIMGLAGNDIIMGGGSSDIICAGEGEDLVRGGRGHDWIFGEDGHDLLYGGRGKDRIYGMDGDDVIEGGRGPDRAWGGQGDDALLGQKGNDKLDGGPGWDRISGRLGNDLLKGRAGEDLLWGLFGSDVANCGPDFDLFDGGPGIDAAVGCEVVANVP